MLRTKFTIEIERLKNNIIELFNLTMKQHKEVIKALEEESISKCKIIVANDNNINKFYAEILDSAIWRIAKQQPVASDLRHIIGYMSIAKELERISDYARNIANFYLKAKPPVKYSKYIGQLSKKVLKIMQFIIKVLADETQWGKKIIQTIVRLDDIVDSEYNDINTLLIDLVLDNVTEDKIWIYTGIMQQLKYLERAGDHLVNIAETLLFISQGTHYESGR
ncbi:MULTISPECIES: phosphate signaling complex protein PhoU [unclassified Spiroplasma]|uniref:phosphate signaling complex protein PhoU n=2 Tax=Spiroplasma TaxID=2132 RepID=UPI00313A8B1B